MNLNDLTDKELMKIYYEAIELQDGILLKECKKEINKRNSE